MTAGSDDPEDERTHASGEEGPEHQEHEHAETPVDGGDRRNGDRGRETTRDPEEPSRPDADADGSDAGGEEWRFKVTEVSDHEGDDDDDQGNVAGVLMRNEPLESESIDVENAFFFLLGSLGTILFVVLAVTGL